MPLIFRSRRRWSSSSGQLVLLVRSVTTPLCTARSVSAGSRRNTGSDVTAARTFASVTRSESGRAVRCRTARLPKFAQRTTSLRLTHAAEARAAIHIKRIRLLTARGIMSVLSYGSLRVTHHRVASNGRVLSTSVQLVSELLTQFGEAGGDQPADVHLAGADPLGDLRLAELLEVAEKEDLALTRAEVVEKPDDDLAVQHVVEVRFDRRVLPGVLIERVGAVRVVGLERLDDGILRNCH